MFSAFEFEAAAELFVQLSRSILDDELYSTVCLLNAAMIYARLGDFSKATQHLSDVEEVEELLPITLCLMGHVEYEIGAFEKSQDCFRIALQAIDEDQAYDHLGLDYSLREDQIHQNLDFLAKRSDQGMVGTIPGDVLFEAPPRKDPLLGGNDDDEHWSIHSIATSRSLESIHTSAPLRSEPPTLDADIETHTLVLQASQCSDGIAAEVPNSPMELPSMRRARVIARYARIRAEGKRSLARMLSLKSSPKAAVAFKDETPLRMLEKSRPRPKARDARPGAYTADLPEYIQQLPIQSKLVPRDARGRPGSINNLAHFFLGTDPIHARAPVGSAGSVNSVSLAEDDVHGLAGQRETMPETSLSSMSSTPESRVAASVRPSGALNELARQPCTESSQGSPKFGEPRPNAVHPALRPGFSLDKQARED